MNYGFALVSLFFAICFMFGAIYALKTFIKEMKKNDNDMYMSLMMFFADIAMIALCVIASIGILKR
jgi:hypothetical protein